MATAKVVSAADLIGHVRYDLRDARIRTYTDPEMLAYLNRMLEDVHSELVDWESELVCTGSGTITTVAGTEEYDLNTASIGDLLLPHAVWVSGMPEMEEVGKSRRYQFVQAEQSSTGSGRGEPYMYYVAASSLGLLPIPDGVYTVYVEYFPEFSPLESVEDPMPYRNMFNRVVEEGLKLISKVRQNRPAVLEGTFMNELKMQVGNIMRKRSAKTSVRVYPRNA